MNSARVVIGSAPATIRTATLVCSLAVFGLGVACGADDAAPAMDGGAGSGGAGSGGSGGAGSGGAGSGGNGTDFDFDAGVKFETPGGACHAFGPTRDALGSALEELTPGLVAREVESTSAGVYFAADGQLHRLAPGASTPTVVVQDALVETRAGLVASDSRIAWVGSVDDDAGVWSIALGEDAPTPVKAIADQGGNLWQLAIDATHAYAWNFYNSNVTRGSMADGTEALFTTYDQPAGFAAEGGFLYIAGSPGLFDPIDLRRIPVAGGDPEIVTSLGDQHAFTMDADRYYTAGRGGIRTRPRSDPTASQTIMSFPSEVTESPQIVVSRFHVYDGVVFFVDLLWNVGWVRIDGSDCGLIVRELSTSGSYPADVAADATYVYLTDSRSGLMRIARSAFGM